MQILDWLLLGVVVLWLLVGLSLYFRRRARRGGCCGDCSACDHDCRK